MDMWLYIIVFFKFLYIVIQICNYHSIFLDIKYQNHVSNIFNTLIKDVYQETNMINNSIVFPQDDVQKDETMEYEANFVCTTSQDGKIQLHLTTESEPVAYILVGSLKSIARLLYDTQTDIRLTSYTNDPRRFK